ncbi:MAG: hypothetical protein K0U39_08680 [Alphaproteobacteria bacterium]|nr:hypothetical protein [Alphaproteobacteria bacterium]
MVKRLFPQQIKGIDEHYGIRIREAPHLYKWEVHAFPDTLTKVNNMLQKQTSVTIPKNPAEIISGTKARALWLAPCKALITSSKPLNINIPPALALSCEQSAGRMGIRITGGCAQYVLQKGVSVPLDRDDDTDFVVQTALHGISLIIDAHKSGFDMYFYRSFAVSFQEWLLQSSLEYGYMRE